MPEIHLLYLNRTTVKTYISGLLGCFLSQAGDPHAVGQVHLAFYCLLPQSHVAPLALFFLLIFFFPPLECDLWWPWTALVGILHTWRDLNRALGPLHKGQSFSPSLAWAQRSQQHMLSSYLFWVVVCAPLTSRYPPDFGYSLFSLYPVCSRPFVRRLSDHLSFLGGPFSFLFCSTFPLMDT